MSAVPDFSRLEIHRKKSFPVRDFLARFGRDLELSLRTADPSPSTEIPGATLHRPGLALAGFTGVYTHHRVQILGDTEWAYLESVGSARREEIFARLREFPAPLWVLTHGAEPHAELLRMCAAQNVPVAVSAHSTRDFYNAAQDVLEAWFAPYGSVHASLVDVYGVGMLYIGESGVGKSECVLDLVERGHRLVADDVVTLTRRGRSVIGRGSKLLGHHMEIRGVGIVDVGKLFGIRAVRGAKKIEVVVELQQWRDGVRYDRTGLDEETVEVVGIPVPKVTVPISPGKNITVISEVIAMNMLLKMTGVDSAKLFNDRLIEAMRDRDSGDDAAGLFLDDHE